ncbi:MAG: hypothetical protein QXF52_03040 [Thermoproteota archaeon]
MNTFRARPPAYVTFIVLIAVFYPTVLLPLKASGEPAINVPLYRSPMIDGTVSAGEYPPAELISTWGSLYAVHNATNLVFGITLGGTFRKIDLLFNKGSLNATTLTVSTVKYSVNRSGVLKYYYGQGNNWIESTASGVSLRVVNGTTSWTVEISISLSKLDVYPNTERTLGFAIVVSGTTLNYSWPGTFLPNNPSTWGTIYSPDNWATRNDICLETVLDKRNVIAGSNVTLVLILTNGGDAAIPDYRIRIMLDTTLIENATGSQLGLKTPLERTDRVRYEKRILNVANGTHTLRVNVTGLGIYYDANEMNNVGTESLTARYAEIEVLGTPGVTVTLGSNSQTVTAEGRIIFYSTVGRKNISAQKVYSPFQGLRYVFTRWSYDGLTAQTPQLAINVNGDLRLTLEHKREYLVNLSFVDDDNVFLTPSFYVCKLTNNTDYNGTLSSLWMVSGDLKISVVNYAGVNILDETKTYGVHEPKEIRVSCKVAGGTVKIIDPLSMPIQGAELTAVFLNNTQAKYVTGPDGTVSISRVAGGKVTLTVINLGYSATVEIDFLVEREITITIPMSLNVVLIILGAMSVIAVIVVYKVFWRREKKPASRRREEYEFEEL